MTINIAEQKQVVREVLQVLWMIDSDTVIAGGAPRNWDEGKLANDIDCYLRWNTRTTRNVLSTLSTLLGYELQSVQEVDCTYDFGSDQFHIEKIVAFRYKEVLFQLILIKEDIAAANFNMSILNHMDIGLNMIAVKSILPNGDVHYLKTAQYKKDREGKTLTLYQNVMNPEQLKHCMTTHLPKMLSYYPEYKLSINNDGGMTQ